MLFRRRNPVEIGERLRTWAWPRRSFWRSGQYFFKRILRLQATPHAVAAGVAAGVFVAFLPIPGFHIVLAAMTAWLVAGNVVASALGTAAAGNPLTFPFIWGGTYEVGHLMLTGDETAAPPLHIGHLLAHAQLGQLWEPVLKPMTIGALPVGLVFAVGIYFATRWAVAAFHERRRARLAADGSRPGRHRHDRAAPLHR